MIWEEWNVDVLLIIVLSYVMFWDFFCCVCVVFDKWYVVVFLWVVVDCEIVLLCVMFWNMVVIVVFDDRDGSDDEVEDGVDGLKWEEVEN